MLEPLRADELPLAAQHPLGISAVRLIPKPNGFRPIVNLGRSIKLSRGLGGGAGYTSTTARARSANFKLRNIHLVLTLERDRHRAELGATLFGTNEIFEPIRQLKLELLGRGGNGQLPRLFFVKMDIKAAFDTIKQEKMLQVVDDMLERVSAVVEHVDTGGADHAESRLSARDCRVAAAPTEQSVSEQHAPIV